MMLRTAHNPSTINRAQIFTQSMNSGSYTAMPHLRCWWRSHSRTLTYSMLLAKAPSISALTIRSITIKWAYITNYFQILLISGELFLNLSKTVIITLKSRYNFDCDSFDYHCARFSMMLNVHPLMQCWHCQSETCESMRQNEANQHLTYLKLATGYLIVLQTQVVVVYPLFKYHLNEIHLVWLRLGDKRRRGGFYGGGDSICIHWYIYMYNVVLCT